MDNKAQAQERRKFPRLSKSLPLKISTDNFDIVTETKNLSCVGAYCEVNKFLQPLTKLKIILLLPFKNKKNIVTKKISCQGVVVRIEPVASKQEQYNVAIYFNDIQKSDINKISKFVSSSLQKE